MTSLTPTPPLNRPEIRAELVNLTNLATAALAASDRPGDAAAASLIGEALGVATDTIGQVYELIGATPRRDGGGTSAEVAAAVRTRIAEARAQLALVHAPPGSIIGEAVTCVDAHLALALQGLEPDGRAGG